MKKKIDSKKMLIDAGTCAIQTKLFACLQPTPEIVEAVIDAIYDPKTRPHIHAYWETLVQEEFSNRNRATVEGAKIHE